MQFLLCYNCTIILHKHTYNRLMALCRALPRWAGNRRNIHHSHQSWSSNIFYRLPPSTMIHSILHKTNKLSRTTSIMMKGATSFCEESSCGWTMHEAKPLDKASCFVFTPMLWHWRTVGGSASGPHKPSSTIQRLRKKIKEKTNWPNST